MSIKRIASITFGGLAVAGAIAAAGAGTAGAIEPVSGEGWTGVVLSRDETVLAAQLHAGDLINLVYGDNWTVNLPHDSIWYTGGWTPVTGHQFISEAASHPRGQVALFMQDTNVYRHPLNAISRW